MALLGALCQTSLITDIFTLKQVSPLHKMEVLIMFPCIGLVACGGFVTNTTDTCLTFTASGEWTQTHVLLYPRYEHVRLGNENVFCLDFKLYLYFSWQSPSGVVLLGGYESGNTSEIVLVTGIHSEQHFDLKYDTRWKIVREMTNELYFDFQGCMCY